MAIQEQLVKRVKASGHSGYVYLPREWLGEEVIIDRPVYPNIRCIVLFGSFVTGKADELSDVDIMVLARDDKTKKKIIQRLHHIKNKRLSFEVLSHPEDNLLFIQEAIQSGVVLFGEGYAKEITKMKIGVEHLYEELLKIKRWLNDLNISNGDICDVSYVLYHCYRELGFIAKFLDYKIPFIKTKSVNTMKEIYRAEKVGIKNKKVYSKQEAIKFRDYLLNITKILIEKLVGGEDDGKKA